MSPQLTDEDVIEIGEAARRYKSHLFKLTPKERAVALGLSANVSTSTLYIAEAAVSDTLTRYFLISQAVAEGKQAVRDVMAGYVFGFAGSSASGMGAKKLNWILDTYSNLRPDKIVQGFFSTREGYAVNCNAKGTCTVVTPERVVLMKP